jgi:hypothetical protein
MVGPAVKKPDSAAISCKWPLDEKTVVVSAFVGGEKTRECMAKEREI